VLATCGRESGSTISRPSVSRRTGVISVDLVSPIHGANGGIVGAARSLAT
jgi:hypothetical protein